MLFFLLPLVLCSCSSSSSNKLIIERNESIDSFVQLTPSSFISSYQSQKDFVIYIGDKSCSSCLISHTYIENYISTTKRMIYFITSEDFSLSKDTLNLPDYESSSLLFIHSGIVKDILSYSKKIYSSQPSFNNELVKRISASYIINVNDFKKMSYSSWKDVYVFDFHSSKNLTKSLTNVPTPVLIKKNYSPYNLFTLPCFAAVATAKSESSKKGFLVTLLWWLGASYVVSLIIYWLGALLEASVIAGIIVILVLIAAVVVLGLYLSGKLTKNKKIA